MAFQLEEEGSKSLEKLLAENKEELRPYIEGAADPESADKLTVEFQKTFEAAIGEEFDEQIAFFHDTIAAIREKLNRLLTADDLNEMELAEKEWVAAVAIAVDDAFKDAEAKIDKEMPMPSAGGG